MFPIVFIGLLLFNLNAIAHQIGDIDSAAVGTKLADRVNSIMPDIEHSLGDLADAAHPAVSRALETESLAMAPLIETRLQKDVDTTLEKAKADLAVSARASMDKDKEAQRALLVKEFPELASDAAAQDAILASAADALVEWEQRKLEGTVSEHLVAMEQLHKTLQSSYAHKDGEVTDPEDALMTWLNLINQHVGGEQKILAKDDAKSGKKAAP